MGLRDEITASVKAAFDTDLADAVKDFRVYRPSQSGAKNPITQNQVGFLLKSYGRGVFGKFASHIADGINILHTDVKLTVLQDDGSASVGDRIYTPFHPDYTVINVSQDAAGVTWTLQLRAER